MSAADAVKAHLLPEAGMTSRLREAGWATALREAGLQVTDDLICAARYERADACRATSEALRLRHRPTALVTTDETMTLGALDALKDADLVTPGDISLVAFDDLPWTSIVVPPLTVIAQPVYELGAAATRRLLGRIAGSEDPPRTVILPTTLIARGSTGPAPAH
jgi:LacI family transcriptional regulator